MLVVALLLLAADVEAHSASQRDKDASPPDWLLYILTIAGIAAGFHFFRSLTVPPKAQQLHQQQLSAQQHSTQQHSALAQPTSAMQADPNKAWTLAELRAYDGSDASKPLLLGCGGKVFDVSSASGFYGPGAAYGVFAGKDASRGLAKMELEYKGADISDLTGSQLVTMQEWVDKFESKYPVVGRIVDSSEPNSGSSASNSTAATTGGADGAMGATANPLVTSAPGV